MSISPKKVRTHYGSIVGFLAALVILLILLNLSVYAPLAMLLDVHGVASYVLAAVLCFLSGSFIVASMIGMRWYNAFTRAYYLASAVWMGAFGYLVIASIVYGAVYLISGETAPLARPIGMLLYALALLASAYGAAHARNIRVKRVEAPLRALPAAWEGRRAIWVSDLHLGQLHGPRLAERVTDATMALSGDVIFIGGDLFDGTGAPDAAELMEPLRKLQAPLGVYYVTGNHEEFGDNSAFLSAIRAAGITVLDDGIVLVDGLQLIGVDYANASRAERFAEILAGLHVDRALPSILLKHEPKDLDVAEAAGISLQISGHTHLGQQWPFGYLAQWRYKGYAYGFKSLRGMLVYVSSGVGTWGPPVRVGTDSEIVEFTFSRG